MNELLNIRRLKLIAVLGVYVAALLWAYVTVVSPVFSYLGFKLYWPSTAGIVWVSFLALIPATFVPLRLQRPSAFAIWWLYVVVYIPAVLVPRLSLTLGDLGLLPLNIAMLLSLAFLTLANSVKLLSIRRLDLNQKLFWRIIFAIWAGCLLFICAQFNPLTLVRNMVLLVAGGTEYTIRGGFFDELSQTGRLLGYAAGQVAEAIDPFLMGYGLVYRNYKILLAGIVGQLVIFAVVGAKSVFFSTLFLVLVFALSRRFSRNFGLGLGLLLTIVILLSTVVDRLSDSVTYSSITTRRTLMEPGLLTGFYYEHYSQVPHAGLAYHFPRGGEAVSSPPYEIGLVYLGDVNIEANANLWAEGFADFGMVGIFGSSLLLAFALWFFDSLAARQNPALGLMLMAMQAFALSNSAVVTVLITHGGLTTALLLWSVPHSEPQPEDSQETAALQLQFN